MSEDKKVKVKVIRHKWADEIEYERRQRNRTIFMVFAIIVSFALGSLVTLGLTSKTTDVASPELSKMEAVYRTMRDSWFFGRDRETLEADLVEDGIRGMVDAQQDPHTIYMDSEEMESFASSLENSIVGIGVRYQFVDDHVLIREILADSPAEEIGLQTGDAIVAVDGVSTKEIGSEAIPDAIKGEEGTSVTLTVLRDGKTFDVEAIRAQVYTSVVSKVLDDKIGYLAISSFGSTTAEELKQHLDRLQEQGIEDLILDIRDNGGGYLSTLLKMASFFLEPGTTVIQEELRDGTIQTSQTSGEPYAFDEIVLLVNNNSASCSEVFVAALREQRGVKIVGVTTYGKGTVQVTRPFADGSALKYTTARWLTPSGASIEGVGVIPDYEVQLDDALYLPYFQLEEDEVYRYDSVSSWTSNAQKVLRFLGYDVKRTDGYFDSSTRSAMRAFQTSQQLPASGVLDSETAQAMNSAVLREWGLNRDQHDVQLQKAVELLHE